MQPVDSERVPSCDLEPTLFSQLYERNIHGYTALLVCTIGTASQLLNLIIFTRKDMITATNVVLAGLATTDLMMALINIPVFWYMAFQLDYLSHQKELSYGWAIALVWHSYFFLVLHMISIWLTMTLAVFRYIAVVQPLKYKYWCNIASVRKIIIIGCVICIIQRIPFLYAGICVHSKENIMGAFHSSCNKNFPIGTNNVLLILAMDQGWLHDYNLVVCSVSSHLAPSVALTVLSFRLLYALKKQENWALCANIQMDETEKKNHRRTKMLLVVLFMFLLTEIPQGFLIITAYISGKRFYGKYYSQLGNPMDLFVITSSSFNFAVYYLMYNRFRTVFKSWLGYEKEIVPDS